jgi:predicted alpha/beta-hydrolase family hydrolase
MSPKAAEVLEQARKLTEDERRELAIELLDSAVAPEIEQAWIDEARQRVTDLDSGKVATLSNEEALRLIAGDEG